jgi:uncharacterized membrane protein
MKDYDKNLGRGAFIYMLIITGCIIIAGFYTAFFIDTIAVMKSPEPGLLEAAMWLIMCLIIPFAVWHSAARKGFKPAIIAAGVTIFAAWLAEAVGVNYGWWFGAYHYTHLFNPKIWGVPLVICIAWEPILYGAYVVTDFIFPVDRDKTRSFSQKMVPIVLLSLIGASVTTILDLVADPDAVGRGWWIWHDGGPYFRDIAGGVPVKNYVGWFKLSFICHVVYRLAAEFGTEDRHSVYLDVYTPPLLYLQLYLFVLGYAWLYLKRPDVVLISMGMGTVCFIAVVKAVMYKMGYWREAYRYLDGGAS